MVVDDEPIARRTLRLMLAADPEVELVAECDAAEALERIPRERLHVGTRTHLVRQTMNELERQLDPERFFRLHRSSIVNLERIRELLPDGDGGHSAVLDDGASLAVGRGRFESLRRRLAT